MPSCLSTSLSAVVELVVCLAAMKETLVGAQDPFPCIQSCFCRLQNSYTASQRTNQDLEEKLHALVSALLSHYREKVKETYVLEAVERRGPGFTQQMWQWVRGEILATTVYSLFRLVS